MASVTPVNSADQPLTVPDQRRTRSLFLALSERVGAQGTIKPAVRCRSRVKDGSLFLESNKKARPNGYHKLKPS